MKLRKKERCGELLNTRQLFHNLSVTLESKETRELIENEIKLVLDFTNESLYNLAEKMKHPDFRKKINQSELLRLLIGMYIGKTIFKNRLTEQKKWIIDPNNLSKVALSFYENRKRTVVYPFQIVENLFETEGKNNNLLF